MIRNMVAVLALIFSFHCFPQTPMPVSETRYDWSGLAQGITQGKATNYDKAYAIYRWLCDNIAYDTSYSIHDADTAYEQKRGVCQAYCEMFYRIGEAIGLNVDIISGKSKDHDRKISDEGHAWVFVRTDGNTGILVDPTWGAGSVDNGRFTHKDNDDSWFHVDPEWMIFTHYPDSEAYQLLDKKIDYPSFVSLPPFDPSLGNFGFTGSQLLSSSLNGRIPDIPKCYGTSKISVVRIPHDGTLRVGASYDFILKSGADYEFTIINGKEFDYSWERNNGNHVIKFVPGESDELVVGYRNRGSKDMWNHLVSYKVASPTSADINNLEKIAPHKSPVLKSLKNFDTDRLRNHGVDMGKLLATVKRENIKQLPVIYDSGNFKLNDVPMNGILKVGKSYQFVFSPYEKGDWVIIENGKFLSEWTQDPQTRAWVTTIVPSAPGKVVLAFKPASATDNRYSYCVAYDAE